jgi:hypothetical protein
LREILEPGEAGTLTNYPVFGLVFNSGGHTVREKSSPLFSWACAASPAPPRSPQRYSEIEKDLLARREAVRFGATSGAYIPAGGNLKPGHAVQRS